MWLTYLIFGPVPLAVGPRRPSEHAAFAGFIVTSFAGSPAALDLLRVVLLWVVFHIFQVILFIFIQIVVAVLIFLVNLFLSSLVSDEETLAADDKMRVWGQERKISLGILRVIFVTWRGAWWDGRFRHLSCHYLDLFLWIAFLLCLSSGGKALSLRWSLCFSEGSRTLGSPA